MPAVVEVTDDADPVLADYRGLTDVALRSRLEPAGGLYMAEGEKVIRRALAAGHRPRSVLTERRWLTSLGPVLDQAAQATGGYPVYVAPAEVLQSVTGYRVHRGALAAMTRPDLPEADSLLAHLGGSAVRANVGPRVAVLEDLVDHANVGAAFRNAAALGVDAVLVTPRCADPLYRRAIKTSMGNVFAVPWARTGAMPELLRTLRRRGYTTAAFTLAAGAITLDDLVHRNVPALAMVFGTEGAGVDARTARQADLRVTIPMEPGVDSLNVAAATAVAFYATRGGARQ